METEKKKSDSVSIFMMDTAHIYAFLSWIYEFSLLSLELLNQG